MELQRTWLAAVSVGSAQYALDYTLKRANGRHSFKKPVSEHHAVQFRFVEMHGLMTSARLMVAAAAQILDAKVGPGFKSDSHACSRSPVHALRNSILSCVHTVLCTRILPTHACVCSPAGPHVCDGQCNGKALCHRRRVQGE